MEELLVILFLDDNTGQLDFDDVAHGRILSYLPIMAAQSRAYL
jgi:hypothetical protein